MYVCDRSLGFSKDLFEQDYVVVAVGIVVVIGRVVVYQ